MRIIITALTYTEVLMGIQSTIKTIINNYDGRKNNYSRDSKKQKGEGDKYSNLVYFCSFDSLGDQ